MIGWFEQFILGLVPGILSSLFNALKITPGSMPPALLATLQAIDATLDAVLQDAPTLPAVPVPPLPPMPTPPTPTA